MTNFCSLDLEERSATMLSEKRTFDKDIWDCIFYKELLSPLLIFFFFLFSFVPSWQGLLYILGQAWKSRPFLLSTHERILSTLGWVESHRQGPSSYGRLFEVLRVLFCALKFIKLMKDRVFSLWNLGTFEEPAAIFRNSIKQQFDSIKSNYTSIQSALHL